MLLPKKNRMKVLYILEILKDEGRPLKRSDIHRILDNRYGIKNQGKTITDILKDMMDCGLVEANIYQEFNKNSEKTTKYTDYYIEPDFEEYELLWLIDNTIFSKQLSVSRANAIVKKLLKYGSKDLARKVGSVDGMRQFYHTPNPTVSNNIDTLSSAIHKTKAVQFIMVDYRLDKSLEAISDYIVVKPVRMVPYNGFYYLIAFDPESSTLKHYRIDKIKDVKITEEFVDYDVANSKLYIDEYLASHSLMQSGNAVPARIKIPETQIGFVIDQFGDKFRVSEVADGQATVSLSSNENDLYLWALEHGDVVEVLEPQSVRNKIRLTVAQMYQKYSCEELDRYDIQLARAQKPIGYTSAYEFICPNADLDNKREWKELTQLTSLLFENNNIKDFSFVETLINLRCVRFEKDQVNDLTFLFRLPKLTLLWLTETNVSDISCLADLHLKHLRLVGNKELTDYSTLLEMKSLRLLYIDSETAEKINITALKKSNPKLKIVVHSKRNGDVTI